MASASASTEKVLEGIKVANFAQAVAGALGASILACYGATVIKIESTTRLDWMRQSEPFIGNEQTPDNAVPFMAANCGGQYGVTLNFAHPQGKEVAKKIVRWADVVIENFAAG
jgi:benzylsuccinate CoA-transferase BbsF subunit